VQKRGQFQSGPYWLDQEPGRDPYYIYWWDKGAGRVKRRSTRRSSLIEAQQVLTEFHLSQIKPDENKPGQGVTLRKIIMKYWLDHGQNTINSDGTQRHLRYFTEFITDAESISLLPTDPTLDDWVPSLVPAFVKYLRSHPSYRERKVFDPDDKEKVIDVIKTPRTRTADTINRIMDDVRSAFNYAADIRLTSWAPKFKHLPKERDELDARKPRLSLDQMADLFVYAFESNERYHLQAYLIAAVSTLARPSAILDISADPSREQLDWDARLLHQNPRGRTQTKKYRPIVPINDYLLPWLKATNSQRQRGLSADAKGKFKSSGYLVEYRGKSISNIRMTWNRAKKHLGWPMVREWDAKMIRHSVATWLRSNKSNFNIDKEDIKIQLGHHRPDVTDIYAIYEPDYLDNIQTGIMQYMQDLEEKVKARNSHITLTPGFVTEVDFKEKRLIS